eukprot:CAMPEP_0197683594 /NCGR_PEP_ID=MMETSP1338-20131121/98204_1 /TAXON_ID=43686 ORGANISM="Pelagodinium beii, Strain RCC1491" /NCGR_SAMPLE_ID=MMETSP1338 /ASSEMBLY_ACC=CAM_ASM_000754 /LENGTH=38 /DNA_ID= /DNA_START= /DNA_END= /DNA_ORIENTATION=
MALAFDPLSSSGCAKFGSKLGRVHRCENITVKSWAASL